jgi:hypothetical protein
VPEHDSPLYVCCAEQGGAAYPGKWVKGNCDISSNGRAIVMQEYEVAYRLAVWRPHKGNPNDLLAAGREADRSA